MRDRAESDAPHHPTAVNTALQETYAPGRQHVQGAQALMAWGPASRATV
jgi:hypothetical protein